MNLRLKKIMQAAMFLALGMVLPFFTSQIKEIGDTLLPMHIPVMLCGLICGAQYGLAVGFILPLLRAVCFSMPPLYPNGVWMAFELATYGLVIGWMYARGKKQSLGYTYVCLLTSMISGRIVWGIAKTILLGFGGKACTFQAFLAGGFLDAIPGIIVQLAVIPAMMSVRNGYKNHTEGDV